MSRKEFLAVVGLGLCSLFGIGSVVRLLIGKSSSDNKGIAGYGGAMYGGRRKQQ